MEFILTLENFREILKTVLCQVCGDPFRNVIYILYYKQRSMLRRHLYYSSYSNETARYKTSEILKTYMDSSVEP